jgi:hypothetical protein
MMKNKICMLQILVRIKFLTTNEKDDLNPLNL